MPWPMKNMSCMKVDDRSKFLHMRKAGSILNSFCFNNLFRHPNFNIHSKNKHWIMQYTQPMDKQKIAFSDFLHRRRLLTLLSADDAIGRLYQRLKQTGLLDNTYIFLSSDHGYHLGQFGMAKGKSQPYETDIRVPFYALGPKVPKAKR